MVPSLEDEIVRLRDRVHDLRAAMAACEVRIVTLEGKLGKLEPEVAALAEGDRIAAAVAERMRKDRRLAIGVGAKLWGFGVTVLGIVDTVFQIRYHR